MTSASLLHFPEALLWCVQLFVSIAGYGAAFLRLFGVRSRSLSFAASSGGGRHALNIELERGALIVTAPWMIASHSASGTFSYPLLGPGYQYGALTASGAAASIILHKVIPFCIPLLILLLSWSPAIETIRAKPYSLCRCLLRGSARRHRHWGSLRASL
jgi:hypothetical protein